MSVMKLDDEDIEEFKRIYHEEFGEELSDAQAERRGRQLLAFYEIIYQVLLKRRAGARQSDSGSSRIDESAPIATVEDGRPDSGANPSPLAVDVPEATTTPPQARQRPRTFP